jgi:DNA-binding NarL/FixJ family response regulator
MPGHIPALDDRSLSRLRRYVLSLQRQTSGTLPMDQLVALARDVKLLSGVTIDLRASEELGAPLVVVRLPEVAAAPVTIGGLTPRENQVCALIAQGRSNKQIAARLFITLATVKDHVHSILQKTGAANRAAIAVAYSSARRTATQ